jgi:hypothetical protein
MSHLGDRVSALADGELDAEARERALAHVAGCAECRSLLEAERRTKRRLATTAVPDLPAGLLARLDLLGGPGDPMPPRGRPMSGASVPPVGAFPTALPAPGRPVADAARRPGAAPYGGSSPYGKPGSRRPAGPGRSGTSRRTARRAAALAGGTLSLSGLAFGAAFWLGGPVEPRPGAPVQPPVDAFLTEHSVSTGRAPLGDPASGTVAGFPTGGTLGRPGPGIATTPPLFQPGTLEPAVLRRGSSVPTAP